jgi:hypothetical protein
MDLVQRIGSIVYSVSDYMLYNKQNLFNLAVTDPPLTVPLDAGTEQYYHLNDEDSQQAMVALANSSVVNGSFGSQYSPFEGNLRAMGQSKIEKTLQVPQMQELVNTFSNITERAGFEPAVRTSPTQPFQGCSISRSDTSP